MADFNKIYPEIIKAEGGYANNPNDTGGETYKGIARKFHKDWEGWKIIENFKLKNGPLKTNQTIQNPYLDTLVKYFYFKKFWEPVKGKEIKSPEAAHIVFDAYVNQTGWTKTMLTDALKNFGKPVKVDSIPLKSDIVTAINSIEPAKFIAEFKNQREKRYRQRAAEVPGQAGFLPGWLNRLSKFESIDVIEVVKRNKKKTVAILLILSIATGALLYFKNK